MTLAPLPADLPPEPADARSPREHLLDGVDVALLLLDADDQVIALNDAARDLLLADAAVLPRALPAALPGLDAGALRALVERARRDGESDDRLQLADGHWVQLRARQVPPACGRGAIAVSASDVTGLVCEQEKASESAELYRSFVERAHAIAFRSDLQFRPYFFHGAVEELTGYRAESFSTGRPRWDQIIHPDDLNARVEGGAPLARGPVHSFEFEYRIVRRDGQVRWVRESVHNLCDASGVPRWVQGSILDITRRKQAEQALQEAQEHFRLAFATSPDAIAINSFADGRYIDVNDGWLALSGLQRDAVIGRTDLELDVWAAREDRQAFAEALRRDSVVRNRELCFRHRSGEAIPTLTSAALLRLGGHTCVLTLARDIRELKRAEQDRRRLELKILEAQKLESLGLLAGGVAHDFNNLLVGILGNLDLARAEPTLSAEVRTLLGNAERAARQAAELALQMQTFTGQGSVEVQRTDLGALIRDMQALLESAIARRAHLLLDLGRDLPCVAADAIQLRQVVLALVTNGAEAIDGEPGQIRITTRVEHTEGSEVVLEVQDSGCGMTGELSERIFEPFFTTKFAGRGLGLSAVRGIVQGHRGAIEVDSMPGRGTTFTVRLPAADTDQGEPRAPQASADGGEWRGHGTALLVDDDAIVLEVGERMLHKLGFRVLRAHDGHEAIALFKQHRQEIRCVVLDQTMPRMDGEATFRALRALDGLLPVVISSGNATQDLQQRFDDSGALAFIQKPYRTADLVAKLRAVLEPHDRA